MVTIINLLIKGWENKNLSNLSRFPQVHICSLARILYYGWHHCLDGSDLSNMDFLLAACILTTVLPAKSSWGGIFKQFRCSGNSNPSISSIVLDLIGLLGQTCSCSSKIWSLCSSDIGYFFGHIQDILLVWVCVFRVFFVFQNRASAKVVALYPVQNNYCWLFLWHSKTGY